MRTLLRYAACAVLLAGTVGALPPASAVSPALPPARFSEQVVVVVTDDWDTNQGMLQAYERVEGQWRARQAAWPVAVGRSGSAWGLGWHPGRHDGPQKREGDGRSPAGVFAIGPAFGYARSAATGLPYQPMQASSYCMDVPGSPLYNQIVDAKVVGEEAVRGSTEPMRLDLNDSKDIRYRQGFVIQHNPDATPGAGSCIFAHLWRTPGEATAGCTAMPAERMKALLRWLHPERTPLFVLLPRAQYLQLQQRWELPPLTAALAGEAGR